MTNANAYGKYETGELVQDIRKGITTQAYRLASGEHLLFLLKIMCSGVVGGFGFTQGALGAGVETTLVDASNNYAYLLNLVGWDWLYKAFWCNYSQATLFRIYREDPVADWTCECYVPAETPNVLHLFNVGWSRAMLEGITGETTHKQYLKNTSANDSFGKAWLIGFQKKGAYDWY